MATLKRRKLNNTQAISTSRLCGYETRNGRPCERPVRGTQYCVVHQSAVWFLRRLPAEVGLVVLDFAEPLSRIAIALCSRNHMDIAKGRKHHMNNEVSHPCINMPAWPQSCWVYQTPRIISLYQEKCKISRRWVFKRSSPREARETGVSQYFLQNFQVTKAEFEGLKRLSMIKTPYSAHFKLWDMGGSVRCLLWAIKRYPWLFGFEGRKRWTCLCCDRVARMMDLPRNRRQFDYQFDRSGEIRFLLEMLLCSQWPECLPAQATFHTGDDGVECLAMRELSEKDLLARRIARAYWKTQRLVTESRNRKREQYPWQSRCLKAHYSTCAIFLRIGLDRRLLGTSCIAAIRGMKVGRRESIITS